MVQLEVRGFLLSLLERLRDEGWDDRGGGSGGSSWSRLRWRGRNRGDQQRLSLLGNANLLTPGLFKRQRSLQTDAICSSGADNKESRLFIFPGKPGAGSWREIYNSLFPEVHAGNVAELGALALPPPLSRAPPLTSFPTGFPSLRQALESLLEVGRT